MTTATATQTTSTSDLSERDRLLLWLTELEIQRVEPQPTGPNGLEFPLGVEQFGYAVLSGGACIYIHLAADDTPALHRWVLHHFDDDGTLLGTDVHLQGLQQPVLTDLGDGTPDPLPDCRDALERQLGCLCVVCNAAEAAVRQLQQGVA